MQSIDQMPLSQIIFIIGHHWSSTNKKKIQYDFSQINMFNVYENPSFFIFIFCGTLHKLGSALDIFIHIEHCWCVTGLWNGPQEEWLIKEKYSPDHWRHWRQTGKKWSCQNVVPLLTSSKKYCRKGETCRQYER